MNRLRLVILLIFAFSIKLSAQNVVHLCIGDDHNFGVPDNPTSFFDWSVSDPSLATIDSGNGTHHILIDLNNTGVFQLLVEEIDANGCSGYDSILVEIHNLPNPNIFAIDPTSFCEGDSVRLQVDSVYVSNIWNNSDTLIYTFADTAGLYFVKVTDTNGCQNISNGIDVVTYPKPSADFWIDGVCFEIETNLIDSSLIASGNIVSWIWDLGDGSYNSGPNILHMYSDADIYDVTLKVVSDFGCLDSITKPLEIFHIPDAQFDFIPHLPSILSPEVNFNNTTIDVSSFVWNFDDGTDTTIENPIHVFSDPGMYEVMLTVMDDNNCIDSISHSIKVMYDFILYIPNTFTPNGDYDNELFKPKGLRMEKYKSYQFVIYNHWGEKVFSTNKVGEGWNGVNAIPGKYAWVIIITDEMGAQQKRVGEVLLIK